MSVTFVLDICQLRFRRHKKYDIYSRVLFPAETLLTSD